MKDKSPIDELYHRIMGCYPKKAGTAYEIISTAVMSKIFNIGGKHDVFQNGLSGTRYQMDGLLGSKIMLEAKDYTLQNKKVGRGDLQKMQGGLSDLPQIEKGIFASASEYTSSAEKYAESSIGNSLQKEIITSEIRPSKSDDEKNRIKVIQVSYTIDFLDSDRGSYSIIWSNGEEKRFNDFLIESGLPEALLRIDLIYNADGTFLTSLEELSRIQQPVADSGRNDLAEGVFEIDGYIKYGTRLFHIKGIAYSIPITRHTETFTIKADGTPELLVSCERLGINKLITDKQLRKFIESVEKKY